MTNSPSDWRPTFIEERNALQRNLDAGKYDGGMAALARSRIKQLDKMLGVG